LSGLIEQVGAAVGGFGDLPAVRAATTGIGLYVVLVWLACSWWVYQDLPRRHTSELAPYVGAAFIVLASPLLFVPALVVYRVIRPGETLSEARYRLFEDRLSQLQVQTMPRCPDCATPVEEGWLLCPSCRAKLGHRCVECGRSMAIDWTVCAWCATAIGEPISADAPQVSQPTVDGEHVFQGQPEAVTA
jgi:hypothetical protein